MYHKNSERSLFYSILIAGLSAGSVTSYFAVTQGQSPAIALVLTVISVLLALICDRFI